MNEDLSIKQQRVSGTYERNEQIIRLYESGKYTQGELTRLYGIGQPRISRIVNRGKPVKKRIKQIKKPNWYDRIFNFLFRIKGEL